MITNSLVLNIVHTFYTSNTTSAASKANQTRGSSAELQPAEDSGNGGSTKVAEKAIVNGDGIGLKFTVDETTGRSVITVYDLDSGSVIRQIPPEEVLAFQRQLQEKKGLLVSRRL